MSDYPRILIVEDDEDDLFLAKRVLSKAGLKNFFHVENGRQALDYLMGTGPYANRNDFPLPDVVFIDLKIPEINGHQVAEWINSRPDFNPIRRYILSSSAEKRDHDRATLANVSGYFVKPLTSVEIAVLKKDLVIPETP